MDDPASLEPCQGELSNFPDMTRTRDRSVICSEPGSFSSVFKMNASYYTQTATEWLEKNDRYQRNLEMSRIMTKPTKWHVRPTKTQIRLGICPV